MDKAQFEKLKPESTRLRKLLGECVPWLLALEREYVRKAKSDILPSISLLGGAVERDFARLNAEAVESLLARIREETNG